MKLRSEPTPPRVLDRARNRWAAGPHGCRISTYSVGSHGYAQLGWYADRAHHMVLAHRAAWEAERGPILEGMTVDHMCKQRRCVNVLHLRLLTNHENARRNTGNDMPLGRCGHGHDDSALRLYSRGTGRKSLGCSVCRAEMQRRYRERKAAAA
jgi:hypothetical protein